MSLGKSDGEKTRIIFHVDFDYFYAQCEELRNPSLRGKPVVVCVYSARGGDSGAVSTASYKAREYGVKSGIPIKLAKNKLKDVPDAVFLPVDWDYYQDMSDRAMQVLRKHADRFEIVGIDEAFIDASQKLEHDFGGARNMALRIKEDLKKEPGLSCSIGVAPNKLVAKIASDFQKPDGLTIIEPHNVKSFLTDLPASKIIGVGKKTEQRLSEMKVRTIGELSGIDIYALTKEFGKKIGTYLYTASRGVDEEPVVESESVKMLSRITTLKKDTNLVEDMLDDLKNLCRDLHNNATEQGFSFRSVGIQLVLEDLSQKTKSRSLKSPSSSADDLYRIARTLLEEAVGETERPVRRLGVKVSELISSRGQDTLFKFMDGER